MQFRHQSVIEPPRKKLQVKRDAPNSVDLVPFSHWEDSSITDGRAIGADIHDGVSDHQPHGAHSRVVTYISEDILLMVDDASSAITMVLHTNGIGKAKALIPNGSCSWVVGATIEKTLSRLTIRAETSIRTRTGPS
uniref:Uncharacterized protein n=1 Tax=Romanomermis culicivorax TaxID=13658 RepID=A0A915IMW5_ROMCU